MFHERKSGRGALPLRVVKSAALSAGEMPNATGHPGWSAFLRTTRTSPGVLTWQPAISQHRDDIKQAPAHEDLSHDHRLESSRL